MTVNEAKTEIEKHIQFLRVNWKPHPDYRVIDGLNVAIKALKKQIPKKPILCMNETSGIFVDYADGQGEYKTQMNNWWKCPCCNSVVGQRVVLHDHVHDQKKKKFCEDCGQKIWWQER